MANYYYQRIPLRRANGGDVEDAPDVTPEPPPEAEAAPADDVQSDEIGDYLRGTIDETPPQKTFPGQSDVEMARKYDTGYGQPIAAYMRPGNARVTNIPQSLVEFWKGSRAPPLLADEFPITKAQSDAYTRAWIAAQRSPVAALGFDPHHIATSQPGSGDPLDIAGMYRPREDTAWFDPRYISTPTHEAMHRGMKILRDYGMFPDIGSPKFPVSEELVVRRLMSNYFGDVEAGRGSVADEQIKAAKQLITNDDIDAIENAAAQLYAKLHPRGPRKSGGRVYADGGSVGWPRVRGPAQPGAFPMPHDVIRKLGGGDMEAGHAAINDTLSGPEGPALSFSGHVHPDTVRRIGNGNLTAGHAALNNFVREVRRRTVNLSQAHRSKFDYSGAPLHHSIARYMPGAKSRYNPWSPGP